MNVHSVFMEASTHVLCTISYVYVFAHVCVCIDPMCASKYMFIYL